MYKIKNFVKKHSEFCLYVWLIISLFICQAILYSVAKQHISFRSFFLDLSFYVILFYLISLIPNKVAKKTFIIFFFALICVIFIADSLYCAHYHGYAAVNSVVEIGNVAGPRNETMGLKIMGRTILQASVLAFGIALIIEVKFPKKEKSAKRFYIKAMSLFTLIACFTLYNYVLFYQIKNKTYASASKYYASDSFLVDSIYSSIKFVDRFGYFSFRFHELMLKNTNESPQNIEKYFEGVENKKQNDHTGAFQDYNVINILSETLDTKLISYIDAKLKSNETPEDDDLVEKLIPTYYSMYSGTAGDDFGWDSGSLVFENYYSPQFATGCTINSEFMSLTGIYPYYNRYWCNNIGNHKSANTNSLYSLPAQLSKDFDTYYFHGNVSSFYNRFELIPNMGFENSLFADSIGYSQFFDGNKWKFDENLIHFFENGIDTSKQFYVSALTYSMHLGSEGVYVDVDERAKNLYDALQGDFDKSVAKEEFNKAFYLYLVKSIYYDNFLKELLLFIKNENVGKTIINIYPDHYNYGLVADDSSGRLYSEYFGTKQTENEVHHMALTTFVTDGFSNYIDFEAGKKQIVYSDFMSTVDLAPTILNWLENDSRPFDYRYFFGNDYFDNPSDNYVYFQNLSIIQNGIEYAIDGSYKKVPGFFEDKNVSNKIITDAQNQLTKILNQLSISKSIINTDFFAWLKSEQGKV